SVFLYDPATNRVDAVAYGVQLADYSVGRLGDGSWHLCVPTPGTINSASAVADAASVVINEWQANPLPGGDDWTELFNRDSNRPAVLKGMYLSTSNALFQITSLSFIAPSGVVQLLDRKSTRLNSSHDQI